MSRRSLAIALATSWALLVGSVASAATPVPDGLPGKPPGYEISPRRALALADDDPKVRAMDDSSGPLTARVEPDSPRRWEIKYFDPAGKQVSLVVVDGSEPRVLESWTGDAVAWPLARGREGQFGHILNASYVWLPMCAVFLLCLWDFRRSRRFAHLDLLVLLSFGIGHLFFNRADIGTSVPLAYPPLIYLLIRMLIVGFRGLRSGDRLRPSAPTWVLVGVLALLIGFRISINLADSGVIDVGYASVVGADKIADGKPIYGELNFPADNPHGDTYGPTAYIAYVPFEQALPWSGGWDSLPAAHAAAIFYDLATILGLGVLGTMLAAGSRRSGLVVAVGWAAFPYTAFTLQSNSNDALVPALVVWALVVFSNPLARGSLLGLAALTKFAPLALVPLFLSGRRGLSLPRAGERTGLRRTVTATAACVAISTLLLAHPAIDPGLATFWDRTIVNQAVRDSPFSIWGQADLGPLRQLVQAGVAGLILALAFVPRRRDLRMICALGAAAMLAAQLTVEHWFYLYIPWFVALLFAVMTPEPTDSTSGSPGRIGQPGP